MILKDKQHFQRFLPSFILTTDRPSDNDVDQVLNKVTLPKLSDSQAMALDVPLTSTEIQEALTSKPNKRLQAQMDSQQSFTMNSGIFWLQYSTECCRKPRKMADFRQI
ncbi:hypothetical protein ATANTOWER_010440 [Ataeniobius toweri]|uniref:Uncharacterized protein n=1 Tax=Ataeniobius toweri TaxID=208326 RepID=A0ABU7B5Z9_9TELE|nr:hypothetical protein [Ataeniobius toweri]